MKKKYSTEDAFYYMSKRLKMLTIYGVSIVLCFITLRSVQILYVFVLYAGRKFTCHFRGGFSSKMVTFSARNTNYCQIYTKFANFAWLYFPSFGHQTLQFSGTAERLFIGGANRAPKVRDI